MLLKLIDIDHLLIILLLTYWSYIFFFYSEMITLTEWCKCSKNAMNHVLKNESCDQTIRAFSYLFLYKVILKINWMEHVKWSSQFYGFLHTIAYNKMASCMFNKRHKHCFIWLTTFL